MFFNELLTYTGSSEITLTEKGLYLDVDKVDVQKDIIEPSKKHWEALSRNNKKNKMVNVSDNEEETQAEDILIPMISEQQEWLFSARDIMSLLFQNRRSISSWEL